MLFVVSTNVGLAGKNFFMQFCDENMKTIHLNYFKNSPKTDSWKFFVYAPKFWQKKNKYGDQNFLKGFPTVFSHKKK